MDKYLQGFYFIMAATSLIWIVLLPPSITLALESIAELRASIKMKNWVQSISDFVYSVLAFCILLFFLFMSVISAFSVYTLIFK